jgi:hypothetical protein
MQQGSEFYHRKWWKSRYDRSWSKRGRKKLFCITTILLMICYEDDLERETRRQETKEKDRKCATDATRDSMSPQFCHSSNSKTITKSTTSLPWRYLSTISLNTMKKKRTDIHSTYLIKRQLSLHKSHNDSSLFWWLAPVVGHSLDLLLCINNRL